LLASALGDFTNDDRFEQGDTKNMSRGACHPRLLPFSSHFAPFVYYPHSSIVAPRSQNAEDLTNLFKRKGAVPVAATCRHRRLNRNLLRCSLVSFLQNTFAGDGN
jgi:hypothetical protein